MDRNVEEYLNAGTLDRSLSARRAWIEISCTCLRTPYVLVALRKESVDRNNRVGNVPLHIVGSLSARRAWIEIGGCLWAPGIILSLSARRAWIEMPAVSQLC